MHYVSHRLITFLLIAIALITVASSRHAFAQEPEAGRPIDMMIVIDDSCSMFPRNQILPGCTTWGSDPDFLRIQGANLIIARLGFGEVNEEEYQVGVISLGDEPVLVSPLTPLKDARDDLARTISRPAPKPATRIIPALNMAYAQLLESPNRNPENLSAVVLLTDGAPWPPDGQSNADFERLISENADVPLFILLLQDVDEFPDRFEQFIRFWQQMQTRYENVFVQTIDEASQIEKTYNDIIAQLHDTVPGEGVDVTPEVPFRVFVSEYVKKLVITIVYPAGQSGGIVLIEDPLGNFVLEDEAGISRFRGEFNPVEVISIGSERLDQSLKETYWTIRTNQDVNIFVDREGSYRINFLSPPVIQTDLNNVYQVAERQNQNLEFVLDFNLVLENGTPILAAQPIYGEVIYPDGAEQILPVPAFLRPDFTGAYQFRFDFAQAYPEILETPGRFIFQLKAGTADPRSPQRIPIATTRLFVDVGPGPYIESISPAKIFCSPGETSTLSVSLGDFRTVDAQSAQVRVIHEDEEVALKPGPDGLFVADLDELCSPILTTLACSSQTVAEFRLQFDGQLRDGTNVPPLVRAIPVEARANACTPTPVPLVPTLVPTTAPAPTPVPDSDQDGLDDLVDKCPHEPGLEIFDGCPPPRWFMLFLNGLGIGVVAFTILVGWPWLRVRVISKPPEAYVMACRRGRQILAPVAIHEIGTRRRTSKVKIGGDKKRAHIYVAGLRPVEFMVVRQEEKVLLVDAKNGAYKGTFRMLTPDEVTAANQEITLYIGLNVKILERQKCKVIGGK